MNSRVGINIQPNLLLHISGDETITNGRLIFSGDAPSAITLLQKIFLIRSDEDILFGADSIVISGQNASTSFADDVMAGNCPIRRRRIQKHSLK